MSGDPLLQLFESEATRHLVRLAGQLAALDASTPQQDIVHDAQASLSALIATADLVAAVELQARANLLRAELAHDGPLSASPEELVGLLQAAVRIRLAQGAATQAPTTHAKETTASLAPAPNLDLLAFFREDLGTCVRDLSQGLLRVEGELDRAASLDRLMRSAHSLKGASRAVGFNAIVAIAHAMEERFVAAQQGRTSLSAEHIDFLLSATDHLTSLLEVPVDRLSPHIEQSSAVLEKLARGIAALEENALSHASLVDVTHRVPPRAAANEGLAAPKPLARNIERLVGLAGESLIEARRARQFVVALGALRRRQTTLAERLQAHAESARSQTLVELQQVAQECGRVTASLLSDFEEYGRILEDVTDRLYSEALRSRMRPFSDGVGSLERLVRDTARRLEKSVKLVIDGDRTEVDRDVLDALQLPLQHLVRNAIDHGLEAPDARLGAGKTAQGTLRVAARHQAGQLLVTVTDDGNGVDLVRLRAKLKERNLVGAAMLERLSEAELLEFLFLPGLSTATHVTDISGRGVGLDVVRSAVESAEGHVRVTTVPHAGTTFHIRLPITRSVVRALVVEIGGEPYALPLPRVERIVRLPVEGLCSLERRLYVELDGQAMGVVHAHRLLDTPARPVGDDVLVIVIGDSARSFALVVDSFVGERDLVVRPLDARLGKVPNVQAAAILDHGSPILILDVDDMLRSIDRLLESDWTSEPAEAPKPAERRKRILVVDDSLTVRETQRQLLLNEGYEVEVAVDGAEGWLAVTNAAYDLVISDIDMPRMNGFQLVRQIKQDARLESLPVVIVSYKDREEDRIKGLEAGANYYLTKASFQDRSLLDAVIDLIGRAA